MCMKIKAEPCLHTDVPIPPIIMATSQGNVEIGIGYCPTITAAAGMAGNNQPILFDNHGPDTRYTGPVE